MAKLLLILLMLLSGALAHGVECKDKDSTNKLKIGEYTNTNTSGRCGEFNTANVFKRPTSGDIDISIEYFFKKGNINYFLEEKESTRDYTCDDDSLCDSVGIGSSIVLLSNTKFRGRGCIWERTEHKKSMLSQEKPSLQTKFADETECKDKDTGLQAQEMRQRPKNQQQDDSIKLEIGDYISFGPHHHCGYSKYPNFHIQPPLTLTIFKKPTSGDDDVSIKWLHSTGTRDYTCSNGNRCAMSGGDDLVRFDVNNYGHYAKDINVDTFERLSLSSNTSFIAEDGCVWERSEHQSPPSEESKNGTANNKL